MLVKMGIFGSRRRKMSRRKMLFLEHKSLEISKAKPSFMLARVEARHGKGREGIIICCLRSHQVQAAVGPRSLTAKHFWDILLLLWGDYSADFTNVISIRQHGYSEWEHETYPGSHLVPHCTLSTRSFQFPSQETDAGLAEGECTA